MNPLELARAKRAEMRAAGQQSERLDPIERARRNPTSKALAIKAKCFECVGAGSDANPRAAVRDCSIAMCPLHPVRPWQAKSCVEENDGDEVSDDE